MLHVEVGVNESLFGVYSPQIAGVRWVGVQRPQCQLRKLGKYRVNFFISLSGLSALCIINQFK